MKTLKIKDITIEVGDWESHLDFMRSHGFDLEPTEEELKEMEEDRKRNPQNYKYLWEQN